MAAQKGDSSKNTSNRLDDYLSKFSNAKNSNIKSECNAADIRAIDMSSDASKLITLLNALIDIFEFEGNTKLGKYVHLDANKHRLARVPPTYV